MLRRVDRRHPLQEVFAALSPMLPALSVTEQRLALTLYRLLADGIPVEPAALAAAIGTPLDETRRLLEGSGLRCLTYYDDAQRIVGFGGLAVVPMAHAFRVDGTALYTWCAWDALFIPELLGQTAEVQSRCPESGRSVTLSVTPAGIRTAEPEASVVSFLLPSAPLFANAAPETMASFCHYVFFFASEGAGEAWVSKHPDTFLLSLDGAFELGRLNNRARFGAVLSAPVRW